MEIYGKKEFTNRYSEVMGITKKEANAIYDAMFNMLSDVICEGNEVAIPNVGKFKIATRSARVARNPQDGTEVEVPEHYVVKFAPSKVIKEAVKNL